MDSSMQLDRKGVSGGGGNGGGDETVVGGEISPVDLPPQSDVGVSGDPELSEGT